MDGDSAGDPVCVTLPAVSRPPHRPDVLLERVFRGSWAVDAGVLTRDQLRSSAWRRLREDVYADARQPDTHRLHARAVSLVMPRTAVLGGPTAAVLWGLADVAGPEDPVEVVLPPPARRDPHPGVRVRAASVARGETVRQGPALRWTSALRTSVDLARRGPYEESVVLVDRMVHAGLVDLRDLRAAVGALPRSRGSRLAREVAAAADGLAESPQETRLRLVLAASGLPMPLAQYEVRQGRDLLARAGFAWPEHRLALEYDGLWHAEPGQFHRDRQRLDRLTAAGWRVVSATAADLHRPAVLVARLAAALG